MPQENYYKSPDDLRAFKVESGVVSEIAIETDQDGPLRYNLVGISNLSPTEVAEAMDEDTEENFEEVVDDVIDCARVGSRPNIKPH